MTVGTLILHLHFPGCASLKEKRSYLKPVLHRLHREFNLSVAELDYNDVWKDALVGCACICNDRTLLEKELHAIPAFVEKYFPDIDILDESYEII